MKIQKKEKIGNDRAELVMRWWNPINSSMTIYQSPVSHKLRLCSLHIAAVVSGWRDVSIY